MKKIKWDYLNKFFKKLKVKDIRFNKLLYNNKFALVFSVIIAFTMWLIVASNDAEGAPVTISDIPVNIELSDSAVQDGLRIFSGQDITARVEIKGNRLIVGQVTKDDIQISALQAASTIMSPGNYTLELSAKKVGILQDYEIVSDVKPSVITVMADRYRETEFDIEQQIEFSPKADYYVGATVLSATKVMLSGPETEISKIKKVAVKANIPGEVGSPVSLRLPIIMYDAYGKQISSETISSDIYEVEANVPVLMKKQVRILDDYENLPKDLKNNYRDIFKVNPPVLDIAGPEEIVSMLDSITLDKIDFSKVSLIDNKFTLPINLPQGCKSLNNGYSADVTINTSLFREKNVAVNQFKFINVPKSKHPHVYDGSLNVTVIAPSVKIGTVRPSDIIAEIDLSNMNEASGSMELPVKLSVKSYGDVWINGQYHVNVNLEN